MIIFSVIITLFASFMLGLPQDAHAQTCPSIPPNTGVATFSTSTDVGNYRVWVRMKAANTTNNSVFITVGNNCPIMAGDSSQISSSQFSWVDYKNGNSSDKMDINLSGGSLSVSVNGNEAGVAVDKVLLTKDLSCVPTGIGDNCKTAPTSPPSNSGPVISGVRAYDITETSAKITWNLDKVATGQIEYGETISYGSATNGETSFDYDYHIQNLSGLTPGTTYHYKVKSQDQSGNQSISSDYTFTTAGGSGGTGITAAPSPTPTLIPTGTITASPNPCTITSDASRCTTTISWTTQNVSNNFSIKLGSGELFSGGPLNGSQEADWIGTPPVIFILSGNGQELDRVSVNGIKLTPTPTHIPSPTPTPTKTPVQTSGSTTKVITLNPTADTYVRSSSPNSNYGNLSQIETDRNPIAISYIKFNLSSLAGKTISKATLRIKVRERSAQPQLLQLLNNTSWTESGMTYNNRPPLTSQITSFNTSSSNSVLNLNVLNSVNSKKGFSISFGINSASGDDWATFYSREASSGNKPVLIVEYR